MFNLRHAQARNVVERIFGVFKKRFQIFSKPTEWPTTTQAKLVHALAVIHNIIRVHDSGDMMNIGKNYLAPEGESVDSGTLAGELSAADKASAETMRDNIATAMWQSYQLWLSKKRRRLLL